jgi:hypothetical protein
MYRMADRPQLDAPATKAHTPALLSKQGVVVTGLARALLACAPGERIGRVQDYAARYNASLGTVQAALEYLHTIDAVRLDARGRRGTYARVLDYPALWRLGTRRPVVGALPLPYSLRFAGLATGLREQFHAAGLDLDMRFMRGATRRLQALSAGDCDWALVSRYSAETAAAHGFAVAAIALLGPESYMAQHVLLVGPPDAEGLRDGMRVGVDFDSNDHTVLVRLLSRGLRVELVPIEYSQGLRLVSSGVIDATVWSREDLPLDLAAPAVIPLDPAAYPQLGPLGEGALVIGQGSRAVAHLLGAVLDVAGLQRTQAAVVRRERQPAY